jgi:hypothetical protein
MACVRCRQIARHNLKQNIRKKEVVSNRLALLRQ